MMSPHLTHYTRSIEAVVGILCNGFAWVPNRRALISDLVPFHPFDEREPQQFGMISFTELEPGNAAAHRKAFGDFGISVSKTWAERHKAQKVIYVDRKGPIFEALRWLFQAGYEQLEAAIEYPDDAALRMAFTNKAMAGVAGGPLWAHLLQLYEYLEPIERSDQQEWRIVHPHPYYGLADSKSEIIKSVSPPQGWAKHLNVVPVEPGDVVQIIYPAPIRDDLRDILPEPYRDVPFQCLDG
jgi:hypothetical protein